MSQCHIHQIHQTRNNSTSPGLGLGPASNGLYVACVCVWSSVRGWSATDTTDQVTHDTHSQYGRVHATLTVGEPVHLARCVSHVCVCGRGRPPTSVVIAVQLVSALATLIDCYQRLHPLNSHQQLNHICRLFRRQSLAMQNNSNQLYLTG